MSPELHDEVEPAITRTSRPRTRSLLSGIAGAAALALVAAGCSGGAGGGEGADTDAIQACNDIAPDYPSGPVEMIVPWAKAAGKGARADA